MSTALTMGGIIATQVGVFNRCSCYTLWGRKGLALPETPSVSNILFWRIDTAYPAIAFLCVGFQLVIVPGLVVWRYSSAIRVFLQKDDDSSNAEWWNAVQNFFGGTGRSFGDRYGEIKRSVRRRMGRRRGQNYQLTEGWEVTPEVSETRATTTSKTGDSESGHSVRHIEDRTTL